MVIYKLITIQGDYALLRTADGIENRVAFALLPQEACDGDTIVFDGLFYTSG